MQGQEARRLPPWISVWLRPRDTIERIVAAESGPRVLLLASLGALAGVVSYYIDSGVTAELLDWRLLLVAVLVGGIVGIANLYVTGFVIAWFGRKLGSRASAPDVRATLAWGAMPAILGLALILAIIIGLNVIGRFPATRSLSGLLKVISGVCGVWSLILTVLMLSRVQRLGAWRTVMVYLICGFFSPILVALAIRTFLFQPFSVPARSMAPTVLAGDYVFASKFSYGYSRYSLPFGPFAFTGQVFAVAPRRGDIVVFAMPKDESTTYIKRVVGLSGDRIQVKKGQLYINGNGVTRERLSDYSGEEPCGPSITAVKRWRETLPNDVSYETLDCVENGFYDNTSEYVVPPGHVFVMGDNRDNSTDSRVLSAMGYIPVQNIFGRAEMIFLSRTNGSGGSSSIRFERIGMLVR